jgi:hypothetical protein
MRLNLRRQRNNAQAAKRMKAARDPTTAPIIVVRDAGVVGTPDPDDAAGPEAELALLVVFVISSA